jgi:hypothetical protein
MNLRAFSQAENIAASNRGDLAGWLSLRPGMADWLLVLLLFAIIHRSQGSMLDDPGVGWHLRNVDAMLAEGAWLTHDPFTWNRVEATWRNNQWLGDLALWSGWKWGGLEGIAAVTTILLALILRHLYRLLSGDGIPWPLALFWTYLAALGISSSFVARPNVFTILGVMVVASTLDRYHRGVCSFRRTLWLLPLMLVWVNTHGGFLAGLMMLVAAVLIEGALTLGIPHGNDRVGAHARMLHLIPLTIAAWVCTLVNPYGWKIYTWIFQLLGNPFFMQFNGEWHSPDFHVLGAFRLELLLLLLPVLLALSRSRPSLMALGLCMLWLHFGLASQRYMPLWVVVTIPLLARLSVGMPYLKNLLNGRSQNLKISPELRLALSKPSVRSSPLVAAMACILLLAWSRWCNDYSYHDPQHIPVTALRHVIDEHGDKRVFHHHDWGGWLTWYGWPRVKNWLDDRAEVQGQQHLMDYQDLMAVRGEWERTLAQQGVDVVCIPPKSSLACQLAMCRSWRETYRDDHAVVFLRTRDSLTVQNIPIGPDYTTIPKSH